MKLGEKLKFIKYLFIRDPPPDLVQKKEFREYLKKVLKIEESVLENIEIEEFIKSDDYNLKDYEINEEYEKFKIKIIVELLRKGKTKNKEKNGINIDLNNNEKLEDNKKENLKQDILINNADMDDIFIYSLIEIYYYDTSQNEYTRGFKNPIEEFKNICRDFNIKCNDELTEIDYKTAGEIKLTSFMLWGSKDGLNRFFKEKKFETVRDYFFQKNERDYAFQEKKAGIYLLVDSNTKSAYMIVWPGNLSYKYSKIDEPNNDLLLTLVRFGFSLSSNSILCLSEEEINSFDPEGYKIFESGNETGYEATRFVPIISDGKIEFRILGENNFDSKQIFNKKIINDIKIKQNYFLSNEKYEGEKNQHQKSNYFTDFINAEGSYDFYFDDKFDISFEYFYKLIKSKLHLLDFYKDKLFYSEEGIKDILREKINKDIDLLFTQFLCDLKEGNLEKYKNKYKCKFCPNKNNLQDLYFNDMNIYFHKSCYIKSVLNGDEESFPKKFIKLQDKINYKEYNKFKKNIEKDKNLLEEFSYLKENLSQFFKDSEKNFQEIRYESYKNYFKIIGVPTTQVLYIINEKYFKEEIELFKDRTFKNISNNINIKNKLIRQAIEGHDQFIKSENKDILIKEWKKNIMNKINEYYIKNKNNIREWIVLKNWKENKNIIIYDFNQLNNIITLYKIIPFNNYKEFNIENNQLENIGEEFEIEDYFLKKDNSDFIVYKNKINELRKLNYKKNTYVDELSKLYDYDRMSDTLILYRDKKIGIFQNFKYIKSCPIDEYLGDSIIQKIMLIPCNENNKNQRALLFIHYEIISIKLSNYSKYPKNINLKDDFSYSDMHFEDFKFIVTINFLMVLKYDFKLKKWVSIIYSLNSHHIDNKKNENDKLKKEDKKGSFFDIISKIEIDENEKTQFSIYEINTKKYLFSVNISNNKPIIKYREIKTNISGISTNFITDEENNKQNYEIPIGNCILNYFFHCFEKYPLNSAIEFKRKDDLSIKLNIFTGNDIEKTIEFQNYINELIRQCENDKEIYFRDINFCFVDKKRIKFDEMNSSIGDLIIKILEVTPIQIAKIIDNKFIVMSNWTNIEKIVKIGKNYQPKEHSNKIKFCIKESIFKYYNYPVIAICCFGTQSIGKSTFLNELTGSLFNVSGMRCTEGIWMNIKLFKNSKLITLEPEEKCNKKCNYCNGKCILSNHKNECLCQECICGISLTNSEGICYLQKEHQNIIKCSYESCRCDCKCNCLCEGHKHKCKKCRKEKKEICSCKCTCTHLPLICYNSSKCFCKNCVCGEGCILKSCKGICCLEKDHQNIIKCSYEDCNCNCKCNCKCINREHKHKCQKCKREKKDECKCKCTCSHLCDIPVLNHNFICVSLDFEGLGTFERKEEQDIQMALVGSAIGNNIIFRIGNSFDRFTEDMLKKLSKGSRKIKFTDIDQFFGGSVFFSPKDILLSAKNSLKSEFIEKIEKFVDKWREDNSELNNIKYNFFGLFDDWIFMPTPEYKKKAFYETLRNAAINNIIEKTWKLQKHPIYETGSSFLNSLRLFLTITYMNNYQVLENINYNISDDYINKCGEYPFEICGIIELNDENKGNEENKNLLIEKNGTRLYMNDKFIQALETDLNNKKKYIINNSLIMDKLNLDPSKFLFGTKDIKINEFNLQLKISKNNDNSYSVEILNFDDFGLILKIPKEITELKYEELCYQFYKIWNKISTVIGLNEKYSSINFKKFIDSIIKRRNNNVERWFKEITRDHEDLYNKYKQKYNIYIEKSKNYINFYEPDFVNKVEIEHDSILNKRWIICKEKCKKCFSRCYLILGHINEHQCFYDHKCKNKCEICQITKCKEENCDLNCTVPLSHDDLHSCQHFHQCNDICNYNDKTKDCEGRCILEYNHKGDHICGLKIHHCKAACYLKGISENCLGVCNLEYPHIEEHNCQIEHLCNKECDLKECSLECKIKCKKIYGHKEEQHICGGIHVCKGICYLKGKAEGCGEKCSLKYLHDDKHNCGKIHYCQQECDYINCKGKCRFEFPHPQEKEHLCKDKKEHSCFKNCYLKEKSTNCKSLCSLKYGHDSQCICSVKKDMHICNKTCFNCGNSCTLEADHAGKHLCGSCSCPKACIYYNISRNCNGKCKYNAGHTNEEHICDSEQHYCKEECYFLNKSRNCNKECNLKYGHSGPHICSTTTHICNIKCKYSGISINCKNLCTLISGHKEVHDCGVEHLCSKKCYLFDKSKGCKQYCKLPYYHEGNHICSLDIDKHLCNKPCSLKDGTKNENCRLNCSLQAGHDKEIMCICEIPKESHICKEKCYLCNNNCSLVTNLVKKHEKHICQLKPKLHKCRGICHLKGQTRTKGECIGICGYYYNHKGKCLCKDGIHICNEDCSLKGIKGCTIKCNKPFGHELSKDNQEHDCISRHLCAKECFYYSKYKDSNNCGKICSLQFNHKGPCICKISNKHVCKEKCHLSEKARGCNKDCKLKYGHKEAHICDIKLEKHTCKDKCQLCNNENECGHVYNHGKVKNLKCFKCNNEICVLEEKEHLCGIEHECKATCEIEGFCEIKITTKTDVKTTTKKGEAIIYSITSEKRMKNNCMEMIPKNKFFHQGTHNCKTPVHKCGFQCIQCEFYCNEKYGHEGKHKGAHGNIKHSTISIKNKEKFAQIKKENKLFDLSEGEKAQIFYCDNYCKDQGQGHIHIFESQKKIISDDVRQINWAFFSNYIYECKCSYFWENILNFERSSYFSNDELNKFSKCNWKCRHFSHTPQNPVYCELDLWHEKQKIENKEEGKWMYNGHIFNCSHPIGIYNIFLLDVSGSMSENYNVPSIRKIKDKQNNMLGVAIEAIENYCKIRNYKSPKDKCALISFNHEAEIVMRDAFVEHYEQIVDECLDKLEPDGQTYFLNAFIAAQHIINSVNRKEIIPIIILLTDGEDHFPQETLTFIDNVSKLILI